MPQFLKNFVNSSNSFVLRPTMSQVFKRFISYVGKVTLEQLPKDWQKPVDDVLTAAEKAVRFTSSTHFGDIILTDIRE